MDDPIIPGRLEVGRDADGTLWLSVTVQVPRWLPGHLTIRLEPDQAQDLQRQLGEALRGER